MTPYYERGGITIYRGDALDVLERLPEQSVNCCVTSPPYWGLRDYGIEGQLGLEPTPEEYTAKLVAIFREVRRVLRDDGTLWLNLGDSYAPDGKWGGETGGKQAYLDDGSRLRAGRQKRNSGLKPKDLVGIPWRVAFALQVDGWFLRQDIIWHKPNPMPESVQDRCTKAHEYIFLLSKSKRYYYDNEAIMEPVASDTNARYERGRSESHKYADGGPGNQTIAKTFNHMSKSGNKSRKPASARGVPVNSDGATNGAVAGSVPWEGNKANKRSVWTVTTKPYKKAHFATFPPDLIKPCILAGCHEGGTVLDPFLGSGTTAEVARKLNCQCIGIELNEKYCEMAANRLKQEVLF